MCRHGDTVKVQVAPGKVADVDRCIAPLVEALNAGGVATFASCCGHGHRPGSIALRDGRYLTITRSREEWHALEENYPLDIHGERTVDRVLREERKAVTEAAGPVVEWLRKHARSLDRTAPPRFQQPIEVSVAELYGMIAALAPLVGERARG